MISFDDAVNIMLMRQGQDSLIKRHMISVRDRYNGDWVIPLTEVPDEPDIEPPIPHLIATAIDDTATRATSTRAEIFVPAINPEAGSSVRRAGARRGFYFACWHQSQIQLLLRRATRHLVGYGVNCMVVVPNFEDNLPKIVVRDPLTAYPDERAPEEVRKPKNIGFIYARSPDWLLTNFPETRDIVGTYHSDMWDVFEWIDETNIYLGVLGPRQTWGEAPNTRAGATGRGAFKIREWPNRAGVVPAVCPGRVTLDRIAGMITKQIGVIDMYAKLMALEAVAAEKAVFPEKYIMSKQDGQIVMISGNEWHDGRTGEINLVSGADAVGQLLPQMNAGTFQVADRLERGIRMSTNQPGLFGGELTGAIRSGQTVSQIGSYAIDPKVQEVQEILEYELTAINEGIHAVAKGYWPDRKYVVFSGWPTQRGFVKTTPAQDFEDPANVVAYGFTGADINTLTVAIGQAMQMKVMDRKTAMRKHPLVENPDDVEKAVILESITDAALASFLARAQQGTLAEIDLMNVASNYSRDGDIIKAIKDAHDEAQKRQATAAPPPGPDQVAAPETQPGLSPPGTAGVEQPAGPGGPPPNGAGFAQLLQALGTGGGGGGTTGPPPAPVPAPA